MIKVFSLLVVVAACCWRTVNAEYSVNVTSENGRTIFDVTLEDGTSFVVGYDENMTPEYPFLNDWDPSLSCLGIHVQNVNGSDLGYPNETSPTRKKRAIPSNLCAVSTRWIYPYWIYWNTGFGAIWWPVIQLPYLPVPWFQYLLWSYCDQTQDCYNFYTPNVSLCSKCRTQWGWTRILVWHSHL
ncbi:uncharacterized protein LOC106170490, partial [Lingula anatina]|uniref:Uncharacterized protein LOC106170490 n=1 Tax=Lingula anatina TaxID=7574 RepID=A0A1S3J5Y2_LINAN